jgi:hypothetical protein
LSWPAAAPGAQLVDLVRGKGLASASVGAALFGDCDAFALSFFDESAFELGEGAHHGEQPITESSRVAIAVSSPVNVSCSLTNWTWTPRAVRPRTVGA